MSMRTLSMTLAASLLAPYVMAADLDVLIEYPRHKNRPYVAVWLESGDKEAVKDLALWHEKGKKKEGKKKEGKKDKDGKKKGDKYLKDLKQWWRSGGSDKDAPIDGVSSATRTAGKHLLHFKAGEAPLGDLPAGDYRLVVEVAREDGDVEALRIPFQWPPSKAESSEVAGERELTRIGLTLTP